MTEEQRRRARLNARRVEWAYEDARKGRRPMPKAKATRPVVTVKHVREEAVMAAALLALGMILAMSLTS